MPRTKKTTAEETTKKATAPKKTTRRKTSTSSTTKKSATTAKKKTTTAKSTTAKKTTTRKRTTKKKEEPKKVVINLYSPEHIIEKFKNSFDSTYHDCNMFLNSSIDFIDKNNLEDKENILKHYKDKVIMDENGDPYLEDKSSNISAIINKYIKELYADRSCSNLMKIDNKEDGENKVKLLKAYCDYIMRCKLDFIKGTTIDKYDNIYQFKNHFVILASLYGEEIDTSDAYSVIAFNIDNMNRLINNLLDKTLDYIYGTLDFTEKSLERYK